ncbi:ribonuclease P protein subunit p20, partial [Phasianus colchicus]|uniref:ribonuclease P protein subunit p20 n=1 Tax=Phasianus colchicus TaxID=9054 RepID=UPI00129DADA8
HQQHQQPQHRRRRGSAPRPPRAPPGSGADVFVSMRTDFRAQLRRCQRLLEPGGGGNGTGTGGVVGGGPEIRLHGLGLAVTRAINLALQLQAASPGALQLHASTSSVTLPAWGGSGDPPQHPHDDEDPDVPPLPPQEDSPDVSAMRPRHNSAIHIRVCREAPCV